MRKLRSNLRLPAFLMVQVLILALLSACGSKSNVETPETMQEEKQLQSDVYTEVDSMPVFQGGETALMNFISSGIRYPDEAKAKNIQGRVIVSFVVEKDGSVTGAAIEKGADPLLDAEALRVTGTLPPFSKPGYKNGTPVRVKFMLPVNYALN